MIQKNQKQNSMLFHRVFKNRITDKLNSSLVVCLEHFAILYFSPILMVVVCWCETVLKQNHVTTLKFWIKI